MQVTFPTATLSLGIVVYGNFHRAAQPMCWQFGLQVHLMSCNHIIIMQVEPGFLDSLDAPKLQILQGRRTLPTGSHTSALW
jgi:hypothetical protein